ncbi:TATA element modulatory factor [Galleria mellonella]|uniref:TATA element modulatory factor n=1 Tax=Galleria mellonella TaxID=7137 RepID=A0ABM3N663_GALME|nr:TATA element modulatory factor [Galleria mellonella]
MNWFDTSGLTSLAKSALKEAQKTIDKALDIQDESSEEQEDEPPSHSGTAGGKSSPGNSNTPSKDNSDFFSSWGLTVSAESTKDEPIKEQPVVTESPSKSTSQSVWGSFAGSFFEQPKSGDGSTIIQPPKAKSMNLISDSKYDSQDDLFSKSQLVMSDGGDGLESKFKSSKDEMFSKDEDRRNSTKSNRLSLVSSRNSSDSVEVLSQSLKTTPDSEAVSCQSMSHSSSTGTKHNSESVEVLPDSLLSPSSIECLGFDSSPSNLSPVGDVSDKKSTPVGDRTERPETADSVSLVADDDEDTMSYNSISECTAPTVLDTEEKPVSPFQKTTRTEPRRGIDKDFIHLDQSVVPYKMQVSENSSNDGSWSDRTLNADNDSIILDTAIEEQKKEHEQEDILIEKLSDSSSFYDVKVTDMLRSESSVFVNVEKQQCSTDSNESSQKESSVKERTSPISSDSKSDLVKIGSDRTSGHTSGDELETATSSDIEIIPSPNGDNGHGFCRNSPGKYAFKQSTSPNLVDLVLGKSLASKVRGHNRELSEASVQSNTSDESQGSENDRLMRRLCEMAEILEARENKLMEVSRSNAELAENNADLKTQVESLMAKHEGGDINLITEDYTQRMSALEKKFQQAIREKDQLRKQLDTLKSESSSRKNSSELENTLKEKDDVIAQLQEEGEKLARQQLQHSNIIKKLRAKEKDNEQVIKSLRDKVADQTAEMDRLKRSMAAKEELEVNQIEAVYNLTTANKKLEIDLIETRGTLEDTQARLESCRAALEAARRELAELQRGAADAARRAARADRLQRDADHARRDADQAAADLRQLRADLQREEKKWVSREEALRAQVREAREHAAALAASGAASGAAGGGEAAGALLQQLAALQRGALDRERAHRAASAAHAQRLAEAEARAAKALESERVSREDAAAARQQLAAAADHAHTLHNKCEELEKLKAEKEAALADLQRRLEEADRAVEDERRQRAALQHDHSALQRERDALEAERSRHAVLQEQMSTRGDISPPHSVASDSLSNSLWNMTAVVCAQEEEGGVGGGSVGGGAVGEEQALAALTRRAGEARQLAAAHARLAAERDQLRRLAARLHARLDHYQSVQEQYDALLQMYGEKEEQMEELKLDLQDVTQLYKAQLDELIALKQKVGSR